MKRQTPKSFLLSRKAAPAVKPKKELPKGLIQHNAENGHPRKGMTAPAGKSLMKRIQELMQVRSKDDDGKFNPEQEQVAKAFIRAMKTGSFNHLKEYIDRESGKVPTRVADADGKNLKIYVNMPTEGDDAP